MICKTCGREIMPGQLYIGKNDGTYYHDYMPYNWCVYNRLPGDPVGIVLRPHPEAYRSHRNANEPPRCAECEREGRPSSGHFTAEHYPALAEAKGGRVKMEQVSCTCKTRERHYHVVGKRSKAVPHNMFYTQGSAELYREKFAPEKRVVESPAACPNCELRPCECEDSAPMTSAEFYRWQNA